MHVHTNLQRFWQTHTYSLSYISHIHMHTLLRMPFITVATAAGWEDDLSPLVRSGPMGRHGNDPCCLKRKTWASGLKQGSSVCIIFVYICYTFTVIYACCFCLTCLSIPPIHSTAAPGGKKEATIYIFLAFIITE